jgi:hypothetical protein
MANRTRDIINLREAARRCRDTASAADASRADQYLRLAVTIDEMIVSLSAANTAEHARHTHR